VVSQQQAAAPVSQHSADKVAAVLASLSPVLQARYKTLTEDLAANEWQRADQDTTKALLLAYGPKSSSAGDVDLDEAKTVPVDDLKAVDQLWMNGSKNRWGFTIQQTILHTNHNHDWKAAYHTMGWDIYDGHMQYVNGKWEFDKDHAPDWHNLKPGEVPTFERGYNHKFSLDGALATAGIVAKQ
jgi:hypothetical protein